MFADIFLPSSLCSKDTRPKMFVLCVILFLSENAFFEWYMIRETPRYRVDEANIQQVNFKECNMYAES